MTGFRHVGLFPEHRVHWDWASSRITHLRQDRGRAPEVLNLFGYTGMASLAAAKAGAKVTHVDASKKAIGWARENQASSNLDDRPIRWICEDAARFVAREVRRGNRYDGIILDPPKYGRGPKNEIWRLEEHLPQLLEDCRALLDDQSSFLILTAYATHLSSLSLRQVCDTAFASLYGTLSFGEMTIRETSAGRLLPTSLFVRWAEAPMVTREIEITSAANPEIKTIRSLTTKKGRAEHNAFLSEGLRHVVEAVRGGWTLKRLVISTKARPGRSWTRRCRPASAMAARSCGSHRL